MSGLMECLIGCLIGWTVTGMNYAKLNGYDIANGPGVRVSLFVSGCRHHCKGCFNPETWDFDYGRVFTFDTYQRLDDLLSFEHISGLSILGGEPLEPENNKTLTVVCKSIKEVYPEKTIWLYTGFTYEHVRDLPIMRYVDVLVDGPFIESLKDISLQFRGSSNQRIIDVKASLERGEVVLWSDDPVFERRKW